MEALYDIEYEMDGINEQETGLSEKEAEKRIKDLEQDGAEQIRKTLR